MGKVKFIFLIIAILFGYYYLTGTYVPPEPTYNGTSFYVASWNLQIFGQTKAANNTLLEDYASKIKNFDIVFVQEIRDAYDTAFQALCHKLPDYECITSSRAGRTSSKEQYGLIYRKGLNLINFTDFNPDSQNRWERPPFLAKISILNKTYLFYTIHTKPEAVPDELLFLDTLVKEKTPTGNVVILGDLNADCDYYTPGEKPIFLNYTWLIRDSDDTTVGKTNCAYDRIIVNNQALQNVIESGIYEDIESYESDHYLVWVRFAIK